MIYGDVNICHAVVDAMAIYHILEPDATKEEKAMPQHY